MCRWWTVGFFGDPEIQSPVGLSRARIHKVSRRIPTSCRIFLTRSTFLRPPTWPKSRWENLWGRQYLPEKGAVKGLRNPEHRPGTCMRDPPIRWTSQILGENWENSPHSLLFPSFASDAQIPPSWVPDISLLAAGTWPRQEKLYVAIQEDFRSTMTQSRCDWGRSCSFDDYLGKKCSRNFPWLTWRTLALVKFWRITSNMGSLTFCLNLTRPWLLSYSLAA